MLGAAHDVRGGETQSLKENDEVKGHNPNAFEHHALLNASHGGRSV